MQRCKLGKQSTSASPVESALASTVVYKSHQLYPSEGVPHIIRGIHTDAHFHGLDDELRVASAASEMQLRLLPCCGHDRVGDGEECLSPSLKFVSAKENLMY